MGSVGAEAGKRCRMAALVLLVPMNFCPAGRVRRGTVSGRERSSTHLSNQCLRGSGKEKPAGFTGAVVSHPLLACLSVFYYCETMATIDDFQKLDIRVGKIVHVDDFPEAKKPAYKLKIDLGKEIGIKASCAQLVTNYSKEQLLKKLVLCVVNFPPRKIGPAVSEVLTLGVPDEKGNCILIAPDRDVPVGGRMY